MANDEPDSIRCYQVVPQAKGWEVIADHRHIGWFSSQAHAVQQAISWAQEDAKDGKAAQVRLETASDDVKIVWSSSK
jgi:hypothetical protein